MDFVSDGGSCMHSVIHSSKEYIVSRSVGGFVLLPFTLAFCRPKGAYGVPIQYERSFRWKLGQFRYLCHSNALPGHVKINVSRDNLFEDSFAQVSWELGHRSLFIFLWPRLYIYIYISTYLSLSLSLSLSVSLSIYIYLCVCHT